MEDGIPAEGGQIRPSTPQQDHVEQRQAAPFMGREIVINKLTFSEQVSRIIDSIKLYLQRIGLFSGQNITAPGDRAPFAENYTEAMRDATIDSLHKHVVAAINSDTSVHPYDAAIAEWGVTWNDSGDEIMEYSDALRQLCQDIAEESVNRANSERRYRKQITNDKVDDVQLKELALHLAKRQVTRILQGLRASKIHGKEAIDREQPELMGLIRWHQERLHEYDADQRDTVQGIIKTVDGLIKTIINDPNAVTKEDLEFVTAQAASLRDSIAPPAASEPEVAAEVGDADPVEGPDTTTNTPTGPVFTLLDEHTAAINAALAVVTEAGNKPAVAVLEGCLTEWEAARVALAKLEDANTLEQSLAPLQKGMMLETEGIIKPFTESPNIDIISLCKAPVERLVAEAAELRARVTEPEEVVQFVGQAHDALLAAVEHGSPAGIVEAFARGIGQLQVQVQVPGEDEPIPVQMLQLQMPILQLLSSLEPGWKVAQKASDKRRVHFEDGTFPGDPEPGTTAEVNPEDALPAYQGEEGAAINAFAQDLAAHRKEMRSQIEELPRAYQELLDKQDKEWNKLLRGLPLTGPVDAAAIPAALQTIQDRDLQGILDAQKALLARLLDAPDLELSEHIEEVKQSVIAALDEADDLIRGDEATDKAFHDALGRYLGRFSADNEAYRDLIDEMEGLKFPNEILRWHDKFAALLRHGFGQQPPEPINRKIHQAQQQAQVLKLMTN